MVGAVGEFGTYPTISGKVSFIASVVFIGVRRVGGHRERRKRGVEGLRRCKWFEERLTLTRRLTFFIVPHSVGIAYVWHCAHCERHPTKVYRMCFQLISREPSKALKGMRLPVLCLLLSMNTGLVWQHSYTCAMGTASLDTHLLLSFVSHLLSRPSSG